MLDDKSEYVVLVDEENNEIGTELKEKIHTGNTPLHRGFSLFLFNSRNELLVTKRAATKRAFPGVWTNTVCGHTGPDESAGDAAKRRLKDELGIELKRSHLVEGQQGETFIREVAPYRYRFADKNGIVENEICPILVGFITDMLQHAGYKIYPDPKEISEWKWMAWEEFLNDIEVRPDVYSPWCREEAKLITSLKT